MKRPLLSLSLLGVLLAGCVTSSNRPPQLVAWSEPEYPASARAQGIEGYVLVRYRVSAAGAVSALEVVEAQPAGVFDAAALAAVRTWRYEPAMVDGTAVAVEAMTTRVTFSMGDGKAYEGY